MGRPKGLSAKPFTLPTMATGVYIDGFNLYYGALKGSPYKWLDLAKLCATLLPNEDITRILYFTARVDHRRDLEAPQRQNAYLRALGTIPRLHVHFGTFSSRPVMMPRFPIPAAGPRTVQVLKTEEKGSDVNLGCHALLDAIQGRVDTSVIISNDSDLAEPVRLISIETSARVGVINPHPREKRSRSLSHHADFRKQLSTYHLAASQFAAVLPDGHGNVHKPAEW